LGEAQRFDWMTGPCAEMMGREHKAGRHVL